ncbi:Abi family protein [Pseudarthrobacter sp. NamE5]|uniref:Abi family protein n=1 Tax=Pseudarthrobacter sp. NamE5 TaxID=2576839 RepID=UPI00110B6AC0|nr:Abi family protein [Pseudarthrobacter sp. NamE5]
MPLSNFLDAQRCDKPTSEKTKFEAWSKTWREAVTSAAEDEDFLKHHLLKYPEQDVPIWAVTEVLSFGSLPFLYELMQTLILNFKRRTAPNSYRPM